MRIALVPALLVGLHYCGLTFAQTAWPASAPQFTRGWSESPVAATLAQPAAITTPDASVPEPKRRFSGLWQGWACRNAVCDVKLAVEQVSEVGATLSYAGANITQGLVTSRMEGRFVGDELHATLGTGGRIVLRSRADGDMEMGIWRDDRRLSVGVLTQKPIDYVRTVERVPTPWTHEGSPVTLEMVVYRPPGAGPFPTLVFNHGSTGNGDKPEWFTLTSAAPEVGKYFVRKGWQVVFPQRRGRGKSGGRYDEGFETDRSRYTCRAEITLAGLDRAVADLDAVMAHLRQRGDVDVKRMMIGGVSRGGILSAVYAGHAPGQFQGVLNFVGGWVGDRCFTANDVNGSAFRRAAAFGKPMLWLYGDKDPFYSLRHSRRNHEVFEAAGGKGRFIAFDAPEGDNGHGVHLYPAVWMPAVEEYVKAAVGP
jgi:dienelactone hydrolase